MNSTSFHFSDDFWLLVAGVCCLLMAISFLVDASASSRFKGLQVNMQTIFGGSRPAKLSAYRKWFVNTFALLSLVFLGFSLATPRGGYTMLPSGKKGDLIVFLLDVSQSMMVEDIKPNRLDRAKREIKDLAKGLAGNRFALVVFAGGAALNAPFTRDVKALFEYVDGANPAMLDWPGTSIKRALEQANAIITADTNESSTTQKAVFVFSDGEDERKKSAKEGIALAKKMHRKGVQIYSFGMGTSTGGNVPDPSGGFYSDSSSKLAISRLEFGVLGKIASAGGGLALKSKPLRADTRQVLAHFRSSSSESALSVAAAPKTDKSEQRRVWNELYQWPLGLALLFLLLESFMGIYSKSDVAADPRRRVKILEARKEEAA